MVLGCRLRKAQHPAFYVGLVVHVEGRPGETPDLGMGGVGTRAAGSGGKGEGGPPVVDTVAGPTVHIGPVGVEGSHRAASGPDPGVEAVVPPTPGQTAAVPVTGSPQPSSLYRRPFPLVTYADTPDPDGEMGRP